MEKRISQQEAERQITLLTADYVARRETENEKIRQLDVQKRQLTREIMLIEDTMSACRTRIADLKLKLAQDKAQIVSRIDFDLKKEQE